MLFRRALKNCDLSPADLVIGRKAPAVKAKIPVLAIAGGLVALGGLAYFATRPKGR
jgi:hypothetical protein